MYVDMKTCSRKFLERASVTSISSFSLSGKSLGNVSSECEQNCLFSRSQELITETEKWVEYICTVKTYFKTNEFLCVGNFSDPSITKLHLRNCVGCFADSWVRNCKPMNNFQDSNNSKSKHQF
jgi:hypothetical protein